MKNLKKVTISLMLTIVMLMSRMISVSAAVSSSALDAAINDTANYMYKTVAKPQVATVGGEWAVIGLARSDYEVPEAYYQAYYKAVESYVKSKGGNLHDKKYTEYSRVAVALTAIGKDPTNVAGYNLLKPLGDYEKTIWQGLNGPIWALIALDSNNYKVPQNPNAKIQATRQMYIDRILECQLPDGGWSLLGGTSSATLDETSDPDITGMALQALAKYQDNKLVKKATNEALACMSKQQNAKGGYSSKNMENSESLVQMIVGLGELGLSIDDPRFVKNNNTMLDNLMTYYRKGNGFLHTLEGDGSNQMASEQSLYGLVSVQRIKNGNNSLYRMEDRLKTPEVGIDTDAKTGLPGKHKDIISIPVKTPGRTFGDINGAKAHKNKVAIEALASRGIINGKATNIYAPDATVTRAEFATIIINSLGLKPSINSKFNDVKKDVWYAPYVGAANNYGIVGGISETAFNPNGTITKQEAAAMVARAAKLSGMNTQVDAAQTRDILAQFPDYVKSAPWARPTLAFCYQEDILDQSDLEIKPTAPMSRGEIAQMVFNLLKVVNLL